MADIKLKNREGVEKGYSGVTTVSIPNATGGGTSEFTMINEVLVNNAAAHNSIFRGSSLGDTITADQAVMISSGTFDELYVGDYWEINNIIWRIAGLDYFYGFGDTACSTHHVAIIPDVSLASFQMNETAVAGGGYVGSYMRRVTMDTIRQIIYNSFDLTHILSHRSLLANSVYSESAAGYVWMDSTVEIPSEIQLYGSSSFGNIYRNAPGHYNGFNVGSDNGQLPLFKVDHSKLIAAYSGTRSSYWLRDVASSESFACVDESGACNSRSANAFLGVRPIFAVC